jgi:hypothetical protein
VQHAGGQGQALLPAAGQAAGQLLLAIGQAQAVEGFVDPLTAAVQAIDPAVKSRFSRIDRSS